jgi:hypothetical protein
MKAKAKFIMIRGKKYLIARDTKGNKIAFRVDGIK